MELENILSLNLRLGVIISMILLIIGLILALVEGGFASALTMPNVSTSSMHIGFADTIKGAVQLQVTSVIFLGLMVLIATPVLRVMLSLVSFLFKRNWIYVVITFIVLVNLIVSIVVIPGIVAK